MGLVQLHRDQWGRIQWEPIAQSLNARKLDKQCEERYNNYLDSIVRPFTPEEDESLMGLVQEYGENQWEIIANELDTERTGIQCRDRYRNHLQPRDRVPLPIPQTNTALADSAPTPITGSDSHATDTSNAATQYGQVLPGAGEH